jgi:hypothetical protein
MNWDRMLDVVHRPEAVEIVFIALIGLAAFICLAMTSEHGDDGWGF